VEVRRLPLDGPLLVIPTVHRDARGAFVEVWQQGRYAAAGIPDVFVQDNQSTSARGTIRGLHLQTGQSKLVRVARGRVFDVAVDLRAGSPTFGQWTSVTLDAEHHHQLYLPAGFAHGIQALTDADVVYKVSAAYDPARETRVAWDDPDIGVAWPLPPGPLSAADASAPTLASLGLQ